MNVPDCVQMYLGYECLGRCMTVYAENECNSASAGPKPGSKRRRVVVLEYSYHVKLPQTCGPYKCKMFLHVIYIRLIMIHHNLVSSKSMRKMHCYYNRNAQVHVW